MTSRVESTKPDPPSKDPRTDTTTDQPAPTDSQAQPTDPKDTTSNTTSVDRGG